MLTYFLEPEKYFFKGDVDAKYGFFKVEQGLITGRPKQTKLINYICPCDDNDTPNYKMGMELRPKTDGVRDFCEWCEKLIPLRKDDDKNGYHRKKCLTCWKTDDNPMEPERRFKTKMRCKDGEIKTINHLIFNFSHSKLLMSKLGRIDWKKSIA